MRNDVGLNCIILCSGVRTRKGVIKIQGREGDLYPPEGLVPVNK